jgi:asparagine synthase (glutamine-hydrolysing)
MCGICGYWNLASGEPIDAGRLTRMNDVMTPRGPDDSGLFVDDSFGMAVRRLSIIDLEGGHQPIGNEDESLWISYNGEIYNFPELREDLIARGHRFRTRTDTETILHLYEQKGTDALSDLNGMFAFAIFDRRSRRLFIARDRVGVKPLFYAHRNGRFVFGSDVKCLILAGGVTDELDPTGIHHYLSLNYIPAPHTIFREVRSLLPGHWLTLDAEAGLRTGCYWDVRYSNGTRGTEAGAIERLREILADSVKKRLLADVPVGVLLSGGIDSSAVASYMCRARREPVKTFSVHFPQSSYSEIPYARTVAGVLGTDHHEVEVDAPDPAFIEKLVWDLGQPYADSSMVPLHHVCRLARQHVKVVLSGDGGDEVFAGYQTYTAYRLASLYRKLPALVSERWVPSLIGRLPTSDRKISLEYRAKRFVRAAALPPEVAHYEYKVLFDEAEKAALYRHGNGNARSYPDSYTLFEDAYRRSDDGGETLNRLLYADTKIYLPDDILVKVDRMSMANSLEARVPLLDYRLVEFAASLPPRLKHRGTTGKVVLRRAMKGILPDAIRRRKKAGFNVPASLWLKGPLRGMVEDYLGERGVRDVGLFKPSAVSGVVADHMNGVQDRSREIWGLLVLHVWHRRLYRELSAEV